MPIAILPCITMVFVAVLPDGVHDVVMFIVPPFIMPEPIDPFMTVPAPKHWASELMFAKFMLLPVRFVLFWVMLKLNEPTCCPDELSIVADQAPVAGFVTLEGFVVPLPQPISMATRVVATSIPKFLFMNVSDDYVRRMAQFFRRE